MAFAVVIVAVARWRGLLALVGIVVAFVVLVVFLLPALRDGAPAASGGPGGVGGDPLRGHLSRPRSKSADQRRTAGHFVGAAAGRRIVLGGNTTGAPDRAIGRTEQQRRAYLGSVSISGLLLAGFIIGSLGVLNDVTVTQASTVFELAHLGGSRRAIFWAPSGSAAITSPARSTRWCWPMRAVRCRCCCCSASPTAHWATC